jgi:tetratricopeptide (TPR) repeat protein
MPVAKTTAHPSIPLPGAATAAGPSHRPLDATTTVAATNPDAVPLPGAGGGDDLEVDLGSGDFGSAQHLGSPPVDSAPNPTEAVALPGGRFGDGDGQAPAAAAPAQDFAIDDFDALAAPPPPQFSASGAIDLGLPPPPAPSSGAPLSFGEVDFGASGGKSDDLEFDPTASPKSSADDLEADLSAPIPSAPATSAGGPADGLEMLSFIDATAREAGAPSETATTVRRFHVKRRSGKVFGPFEEAVVVKMLEDGQLLGNEEVSLDAENWQPIGSEPTFQAVIARLMEAPSRSATVQALPTVAKQKGPSMDRLKQLYEGRMAAVAVVQGKEPVPFKKRLPYLVAGVLVLTILVTGLVLGTTPYGFFALKLLFPAKVKADTREFGYLQEARKAFLADTWKSYSAAKALAEQALAVKEYPEARAVWCQAVFYLDRKYKKADAGDLARARSELVNIALLGEKHPEVLKAMAGEALQQRRADDAMKYISELLARDEGDLEARFLRAEAYLLKKQAQQAAAEYEAILKKDPKSARALHALGVLLAARGQHDEAAGKFAEALEAAPTHLASAVELAEISILKRRDGVRGAELLDRALAEDARGLLGKAETGKALALRAELKVLEGKPSEAVGLFEEALKADPDNAFAQGGLAHTLLELHQADKAVPLYQKATQAVPESLEYTEGYLSALIAVGKMDEATRVVQAATARFPGNAMLSYLSARVADALDNPKEAEEAYKRAIAADPNIADAYLYLARLYMRFRRFAEARPQLEAGLEKAPDYAALRVGMGELAFHERDLDRAEREFKKATELDPNSADAQLGLSRVSLERGKYELAAAQVEKALELNPRIPGGRLQRGMALWKLKRLDEAIQELEQARAEDPKNTQLTVTLGAVEFEKGDLAAALGHLNAALIAEPGHPDANFYLARLKNSRQEHTQAIEAMKRALDYNSKNPLYHYWMGRIYHDARKTDDAIAEWKLALEIDPRYADALEALGAVYLERNDFKRAISYFEQALAADPSRLEARAAIGDAQMKMEDWKSAIATFQAVLAADPEMKGAWFKLGQAYEESRQFPRAIEHYKHALKLNPDDAEAWLRLGWLYKDTRKKKEAVAAFTRYLELRPDADNAREIQDEISYMTETTRE